MSSPAPLWTAAHLAIASGGTMPNPFDTTGVAIDTRRMVAGELFVALVGENGDGHDHVATALAQGAAGALVHADVPGLPAGAPLLRVADTQAALHRLASFARGRFTGRLAAVTGSVGKTTTKEMLRAILTPQGATHVAEASYNNHWGLPLTLARLPAEARFCVVEIGMNRAGEIEPLARLARPHVAVVTAIERAHVGPLGSIEAIADEKASILRGLEPGGIAVLPRDTPMLPRLARAARDAVVTTFGAGDLADARLLEAEGDAEGTDILARVAGQTLRFRIGAAGRHMAMDALAALAVAAALGADVQAGAAALEGFAPLAGRGARRMIAVPGGQVRLLDESYNASSASVRAALAVLGMQPAARRIAVLGDMLELGEDGPDEHLGLAADAAASADLVFACGPLMRGLFDALPPARQGVHAPDAAALAPIVAAAVRPDDAILVKGSLGMRMQRVIDALHAAGGTG